MLSISLDIVLDPNVVIDFVVNFGFVRVFVLVVRATCACRFYVYVLRARVRGTLTFYVLRVLPLCTF